MKRMPLLNNVHGHEYLCTKEFGGGRGNWGEVLPLGLVKTLSKFGVGSYTSLSGPSSSSFFSSRYKDGIKN